MSAHNPEARAAAGAMPVVLFGVYGRTVESYRPPEGDLGTAAPAQHRHKWVPVSGPHLRVVRERSARNKTGIVGISFSRARDGGRYVYVNLGSTSRRFNLATLGREEALRRAIALRKEHVRKLLQANAVILAARAKRSCTL